MESITSRTNPLITRIRKLTGDRKYRRREGVMVCEGPKMLAEALRWGAGLETILWQTGTHPPAGIPQGVRQVEVPGDLLRSVAPTETPQQVLFLARLPARALPDKYFLIQFNLYKTKLYKSNISISSKLLLYGPLTAISSSG